MTLRILMVEDSDTDAKLVLYELRRLKTPFDYRRVEDAPAMLAALQEHDWDIILCDWSLPHFSALAALELVKQSGQAIPLVVVSGTIGEEAAAGVIRAGASDYVLKDKLGRLVLVVEREIEERRQRIEFLRRRKEDERFFNLSLDLLCIAGFDGYLKRVNAAWSRVLGWSTEELLATPLNDLIHPADLANTLAAGQLTPGIPNNIVGLENRLRCKDDSYRSFLWTAVPVVADQVVFAAAHDISSRKRLEDQLRQSHKMEAIGSLAGGVAHDFNNLLSVILSYSDLLLDDFTSDDPRRADLAEIHRAGIRATDLTRQLLAFSRQQVLEPKILDLNEVVVSLEKMLGRLLREDVHLAILPSSLIGRIRADRGQIEQVILNLAVNARDAMPQGGELLIETSAVYIDASVSTNRPGLATGRYVQLTVTDSGCGMDAATRAHIFEPFFTTKSVGKGTGLGLSTVFGVVQQSGGRVYVESEVGRGTRFDILLPETDDPETAAQAAPIVAQTLRGNETILLVEDEDQVRLIAHTILRRNGYQVLESRNGGEAFLLCERHVGTIDLLLTDMVMPMMSGSELAKRLLTLRPGLKLLYMSGYTDDPAVYQQSEGSVAYLQKPLTPEGLLRKVRTVLDA